MPPCTFMALTYTDDGGEIIYDTRFTKCPDLVVADSKIIANAPARLLAAGMGDAIATWYEGKPADRIRMEFILQSLRLE